MSDEQSAPAAFDPAKPVVVDELVALLLKRKELGVLRYGVPLQPSNGRDMHQDLVEELLDALVYQHGLVLEWKRRANDAAATLGHNRVATNEAGQEVVRLRELLAAAVRYGNLPKSLLVVIAEQVPGIERVEIRP